MYSKQWHCRCSCWWHTDYAESCISFPLTRCFSSSDMALRSVVLNKSKFNQCFAFFPFQSDPTFESYLQHTRLAIEFVKIVLVTSVTLGDTGVLIECGGACASRPIIHDGGASVIDCRWSKENENQSLFLLKLHLNWWIWVYRYIKLWRMTEMHVKH